MPANDMTIGELGTRASRSRMSRSTTEPASGCADDDSLTTMSASAAFQLGVPYSNRSIAHWCRRELFKKRKTYIRPKRKKDEQHTLKGGMEGVAAAVLGWWWFLRWSGQSAHHFPILAILGNGRTPSASSDALPPPSSDKNRSSTLCFHPQPLELSSLLPTPLAILLSPSLTHTTTAPYSCSHLITLVLNP